MNIQEQAKAFAALANQTGINCKAYPLLGNFHIYKGVIAVYQDFGLTVNEDKEAKHEALVLLLPHQVHSLNEVRVTPEGNLYLTDIRYGSMTTPAHIEVYERIFNETHKGTFTSKVTALYSFDAPLPDAPVR